MKDFGHLNMGQMTKLLLMDAHGRDTLAIERVENGQFIKADIFDHPVSFNINEVTQVDTPEEALSASLNKYGYVNLGYMATLTSMDVSDLIQGLQGRIYYNPLITGFEVKDRFIAGNVIVSNGARCSSKEEKRMVRNMSKTRLSRSRWKPSKHPFLNVSSLQTLTLTSVSVGFRQVCSLPI